MKYLFNGNLAPEIIEGWFNKDVLCLYGASKSYTIDHSELRKISNENIMRPLKKGRGSSTLINPIGISQWICRTMKLSVHEKIEYIKELEDQKLIDKKKYLFYPRIETDFMKELNDTFNELGYFGMEKQYNVYEGIICDAYININNKKIIIEFDENRHLAYDENKEKIRENKIIEYGYYIIRIDDKSSTGKSIGFILKSIKEIINKKNKNNIFKIWNNYGN